MKDICDKHKKPDCMKCFYTTPPTDQKANGVTIEDIDKAAALLKSELDKQ